MVVELGTCKMMAESLPKGDDPIEDENEILTKENSKSSVWDDEW